MPTYFYFLLIFWIGSFIGVVIMSKKRIRKLDLRNRELDLVETLQYKFYYYDTVNSKVTLESFSSTIKDTSKYLLERKDFSWAHDRSSFELSHGAIATKN